VIGGWKTGASLLITAPVGAGKTTRVPPQLLPDVDGALWVVEPRRIAARMAARRVAESMNEPVGHSCGYRVRFERQAGPSTRLCYVTEGVLLRRFASRPDLDGIGGILFDEFHERHLEGDLALALAVALRDTRRRDLRLGVMSATLDVEPIARFLGASQPVSFGERPFPVDVSYAPGPHGDRPLEVRVRSVLRDLLRDDPGGHVLVFLPGAAEIRRTADALAEIAAERGLIVLPLHGELSPGEQDRAVLPGPDRRVILSTNVAESSITIDGVGAVIDSGLARVATHSPWTGLGELRVAAISRASADQRAGRAGRTGPGRCVRLYSEQDYRTRPAQDTPEVLRADLASALLLLLSLGHLPRSFAWYEPPPPATVAAAVDLLRAIGAVDAGESITAAGAEIASLPVHPRLGRLIVDGNARGVGRDAAAAAALIAERSVRPRARDGERHAEVSGTSDITDWVERWRERREIDRRAARAADQLTGALARGLRQDERLDPEQRENQLRRALLGAFPDRVARRRHSRGDDLVLCGGGAARLDGASIVRDAELVVVVRAQARGGATLAEAVSAIEPEWLIDDRAADLAEDEELVLDPASQRVEVVSRLRYGCVVLDESRRPPGAHEIVRASELLAEAVWTGPGGIAGFCGDGTLDAWLSRLTFARTAMPELGLPTAGERELREALAAAARGATSLAELRGDDVIGHLRTLTLGARERELDRVAPGQLELRSGRRVTVHYEPDRPPWVASRIQDFFGMVDTPTIAGGRVRLTLHLLAPNQRAVQVTSDLAGFWSKHYPALRKQLERRYPRHAWPDDPRVPQPGMRPRR
jgi:ATP-dependent helicase HrpB